MNLDHAVLTLCLKGIQQRHGMGRWFKYEASWALDKEYKKIIAQVWTQHLPLGVGWENIDLKHSRCKKNHNVGSK